MRLDNSGIDYSRMLLFVFSFLVYWKIEPNSRAFSPLRQHQSEARIIGVIAEQPKVIWFAERSHEPIIRIWSCDHEHKQ